MINTNERYHRVRHSCQSKVLHLTRSNGKKTLAGSVREPFASDRGHIDKRFKIKGTNVPGSKSSPMDVKVWDVWCKETDLMDIFGDDPDKSCIPQDQIIQFLNKYAWTLLKDGEQNFFLFKVSNTFFVAKVQFAGHTDNRALVWLVDPRELKEKITTIYDYRVVLPIQVSEA